MTVPSQDPIDALAEASKRPSIRETVSQSPFFAIANMLRTVSSDVRGTSSPSPYVRNIQPIDCDKMGELLDAVAERIEQLLAVISVPKEENATKGDGK